MHDVFHITKEDETGTCHCQTRKHLPWPSHWTKCRVEPSESTLITSVTSLTVIIVFPSLVDPTLVSEKGNMCSYVLVLLLYSFQTHRPAPAGGGQHLPVGSTSHPHLPQRPVIPEARSASQGLSSTGGQDPPGGHGWSNSTWSCDEHCYINMHTLVLQVPSEKVGLGWV